MKIGFKLLIVLIILNLVSIGAVGITLLLRSSESIQDLSYDYVQSVANESATEIENRNYTLKYIDKRELNSPNKTAYVKSRC